MNKSVATKESDYKKMWNNFGANEKVPEVCGMKWKEVRDNVDEQKWKARNIKQLGAITLKNEAKIGRK